MSSPSISQAGLLQNLGSVRVHGLVISDIYCIVL